METSSLDVKHYLSAILFLQDHYKFTKKKNSDFSYQTWANELNVTSKSYLRLAVFGKRKISEDLAQKFCEYLRLNEVDREYFCLLVLYSQSTNKEQKQMYGRKLTQLLKNQVQKIPIEPVDDFISDPLNMIIRNILSFEDIDRSVSHLAKIFLLDEKVIQEKLINLEKNNLAKKNGDQWHAIHDFVQVKAKPGHQGMRSYHKQSLLKAIEAQSYPVEQRIFQSITVALEKDEYEQYQKDMNDFIQSMIAKYNRQTLGNRKIYQLNFNAIPWTHTATQFLPEA